MNTVLAKEKGAVSFYNNPIVKRKLESEDPIRGAFELAYFDTQRTFRGLLKCENRKVIKNRIYEIIKDFYNDYANNILHYSKKDFDGTFKFKCEAIIKTGKDNGYAEIHLGQCQKLLNMFFKYIALIDDRLNAHLDYLHIPLDSIMLNGFQDVYKSHKIATYAKKCIPWSKIEEWDTYLGLQSELRGIFACPIIFEYNTWDIWKNIY